MNQPSRVQRNEHATWSESLPRIFYWRANAGGWPNYSARHCLWFNHLHSPC